MENSFLFVYGSLRPQAGTPQGQWLAEQGHYLGSGIVRGQLYRLGWYPALGPGHDPPSSTVSAGFFRFLTSPFIGPQGFQARNDPFLQKLV